MDDFGNDFIVLQDEDGNEIEFEHLDTVEEGGEVYLVMSPVYDNETSTSETEGEVVIFKVEEEGDEEVLVSVDNDEEAERIYNIFIQRVQGDYDEGDEEDEDEDDE